MRWVLVRNPTNHSPPQTLLCTDLTRDATQIPSSRRNSDPVVVRAKLERRGHLSGSAPPPRRDDPAPVVGHGDCPHHALPARPVLDRHATGRKALGLPTAITRHGRMVSQTAPDLRRRAGGCTLRDLARAHFGDITAQTPPHKTSLPPARRLGLRPLSRRMIGQSRAKSF